MKIKPFELLVVLVILLFAYIGISQWKSNRNKEQEFYNRIEKMNSNFAKVDSIQKSLIVQIDSLAAEQKKSLNKYEPAIQKYKSKYRNMPANYDTLPVFPE